MPQQLNSNAGKIRAAIVANPEMSNKEIAVLVGKCRHSFGGSTGRAGEFNELLPTYYIAQVRRKMGDVPILKASCENCVFWWNRRLETGDYEGAEGDCRRNPPVIQLAMNEKYGVWPGTLHIDWCGEHTPKDGRFDKPKTAEST
jgi:hypothetical protein